MGNSYNAHLHIKERKLFAQMTEAFNTDKVLYESLKKEWFLLCDRMMANIEAHESPEYVEAMWTNSHRIERAIEGESLSAPDELKTPTTEAIDNNDDTEETPIKSK